MGGGKGGQKETQQMVLDPQTQQYVQQNRDIAGGLAGNIFNRPESFFGGPNYQMMQGVGGLQGAAGQAGQLANLGFGMGGAGAGNFLQGQGAAAHPGPPVEMPGGGNDPVLTRRPHGRQVVRGTGGEVEANGR